MRITYESPLEEPETPSLGGLAITWVTVTTVPSDNVESPVVVMTGGAVRVTWLSVVSVIETGVEKVDSGVSVIVLVIVGCVLCAIPEVSRPVGNPVTEAGGNGATGDTVTEALLGTAGLTGEILLGNSGAPETVGKGGKTVLGNSGAPEAVGEDSEGKTGDGLFDTLTEALLGTAGLAGETVLGNFGAPGAVGEDPEGRVVVWEAGAGTRGESGLAFTTVDLDEVLDEAEDDDDFAWVGEEDSGFAGGPDELTSRLEGVPGATRIDEVTSTPDDLGEIGCGEDVVDTVEVLVSLVEDMFNAWWPAPGEEPLVGVRPVEGVAVDVAGG